MRLILACALLGGFGGLTAPACQQQEAPPGPAPDDTAGPDMSGAMERRMANCPSTVRGAITRIAPTPDGIDVTVTANDPAAAQRIAELAQFHSRSEPVLAWPHWGLQGGGGKIGYCPIMHRDATVTSTLVPGGARIHISARSPSDVKALQDTISARAARLPGFTSS